MIWGPFWCVASVTHEACMMCEVCVCVCVCDVWGVLCAGSPCPQASTPSWGCRGASFWACSGSTSPRTPTTSSSSPPWMSSPNSPKWLASSAPRSGWTSSCHPPSWPIGSTPAASFAWSLWLWEPGKSLSVSLWLWEPQCWSVAVSLSVSLWLWEPVLAPIMYYIYIHVYIYIAATYSWCLCTQDECRGPQVSFGIPDYYVQPPLWIYGGLCQSNVRTHTPVCILTNIHCTCTCTYV